MWHVGGNRHACLHGQHTCTWPEMDLSWSSHRSPIIHMWAHPGTHARSPPCTPVHESVVRIKTCIASLHARLKFLPSLSCGRRKQIEEARQMHSEGGAPTLTQVATWHGKSRSTSHWSAFKCSCAEALYLCLCQLSDSMTGSLLSQLSQQYQLSPALHQNTHAFNDKQFTTSASTMLHVNNGGEHLKQSSCAQAS